MPEKVDCRLKKNKDLKACKIKSKCSGKSNYKKCLYKHPEFKKDRERREMRLFLSRIFTIIIGLLLMASYFLIYYFTKNLFFRVVGFLVIPIGFIITILGFVALMNYLSR